MSVGQYLPPPLDSVSEVIHVFHPYQVRGSQCGNLRIFLSLKFYVKSILENLEVLKLPFLPLLGALKFDNPPKSTKIKSLSF